MHFIFEEEPKFHWPVTIQAPNNGVTEAVKLSVEFRLLSNDAIQEKLDQPAGELGLLEHITVTLSPENQTSLTKDQHKRLLSYSFVQQAIFSAYQQALLGQEEKN